MEPSNVHRIIGVDPGTVVLGFAILTIQSKVAQITEMGVLHLSKYEDHYTRLQYIHERIQGLIKEFKPQQMAIEAPFFGKNVQAMLKLGRAQGVAMAVGMTNGVNVFEYSPRKIKQSITGNGNATKEQVAAMLEHIFKVKLDKYAWDATDALATGMCHFYQSKGQVNQTEKYQDWSSFIRNNPNKIKRK